MASLEASTRQALYAQIATQGEAEYVRLALQHELLARAMGGERKMVRAPLPSAPKILDSATADGLWMVAMARLVAGADFVGADLEANHFEHRKDVPANVSFVKQSVFDIWPDSYQSAFDLVHQKYCLSSGSLEQAADAVKKLVQCAKPGGYVQLVEPDISDYRIEGDEHSGFRMLADFVNKAFHGAKLNPNPGHYARSWLEQAGLQDIHEEVVAYEVGVSEPEAEYATKSEVSILSMVDMYDSVAANIPDYFYSKEDFVKLREAVEKELQTIGNRWQVHVVWGRRPVA